MLGLLQPEKQIANHSIAWLAINADFFLIYLHLSVGLPDSHTIFSE